eukprot:s2236_g4.t1
MLPSMHVSGSNMSNDTEVASMSKNISSWNLSASEMESICMAAWDVETCLFNQTCCHEAERLLPAQLLELDPREICESAGRNYTSVCDQGHHDDHDQEDRCSQCNPPLHDLEHMISTMNMSTASADELELACMMSITVETCFAYSHCCDQLEDLLHLPSGDGNKTDFASICSGVGLWRPSICEAVHPPPHEHDEHDDGNGRDEDMCNHTGMQACNASIQMLSQLVMNSTQNGTHNMSEDDAARVCAMASGVEMCIHNMSCCRDAEYYLPKSLIDMDVEHTCHLGGMNATHYCSKGDDDHSHSHCDRPAFDTCGAAVDELTDLVNRRRLIPHLHKPNTTHNTSGTEHHMHNMTGPMMNMTVLHNMSIDELGEICLMGIGIESCLLNTTCCEDAETILPASLMGVDLGVVCEHAGYRYAPICRRGEDHMHCDHRALDACREVGRKMEEELHFLESDPDRVCHLGNEITDCIRRAGCCEDQEADHLVPEDVMTRLLPTCVARGYVYVCDDRPPHEGECDKMAKFHCDMERLNMTMAMGLISDDGSISPDFLQKSCEVSQMTTMCYERAHCCGEREMEDLGSMSSMCETMGMHFSCMKDDGGHHHGQCAITDALACSLQLPHDAEGSASGVMTEEMCQAVTGYYSCLERTQCCEQFGWPPMEAAGMEDAMKVCENFGFHVPHCEQVSHCPCESGKLGNKICDWECNTLECGYDNGDCTSTGPGGGDGDRPEDFVSIYCGDACRVETWPMMTSCIPFLHDCAQYAKAFGAFAFTTEMNGPHCAPGDMQCSIYTDDVVIFNASIGECGRFALANNSCTQYTDSGTFYIKYSLLPMIVPAIAGNLEELGEEERAFWRSWSRVYSELAHPLAIAASTSCFCDACPGDAAATFRYLLSPGVNMLVAGYDSSSADQVNGQEVLSTACMASEALGCLDQNRDICGPFGQKLTGQVEPDGSVDVTSPFASLIAAGLATTSGEICEAIEFPDEGPPRINCGDFPPCHDWLPYCPVEDAAGSVSCAGECGPDQVLCFSSDGDAFGNGMMGSFSRSCYSREHGCPQDSGTDDHGQCNEEKADACVPSELENLSPDAGADFWTEDLCWKAAGRGRARAPCGPDVAMKF